MISKFSILFLLRHTITIVAVKRDDKILISEYSIFKMGLNDWIH